MSDNKAEQENGISRRKFLKILGSGGAVGIAGCADGASQKILPFVKAEQEMITGNAVWYSSTCNECSAGCGIRVRTREGRAVKIEGNPEHPVNSGGLCALGQSALQNLYDPDRVREPLARALGSDVFSPLSWEEGYAKVSAVLSDRSKRKAIVTGEVTGALDQLLDDWCKAFGVTRVTFDATSQTAHAKAAELTYGVYGIPKYSFDKAKVVVSFGADYLETWVSPVEYARDWAKTRKSSHPARVVHIEPRLSLTGANADLWLSAKPGTEVKIALAILKILLDYRLGDNLRDDIRRNIEGLVKGIEVAKVAIETGVPEDKILLVANYLKEAQKASLVLAGGAATQSENPLPLYVTCGFLNLVLQNVHPNHTIDISSPRVPATSYSDLSNLITAMQERKIDALFVYGSNPAFSLPPSYEFTYAAKQVPLTVSFSSHLDETAMLSHLVLPSSTALESWGDSRPRNNVYGLMQPVMTPVFNTRGFGDMLIEFASALEKTAVTGGAASFSGYLKDSWSKMHAARGDGGQFEKFWLESVERGGYFPSDSASEPTRVQVSQSVFNLKFTTAEFSTEGAGQTDLVLLPYPSVRTFDGRAANRPWLQELPDPMSHVVWDSWAEVHPKTAARLGLKEGDAVRVKNYFGNIEVPLLLAPYIHEGVVGVPLGQGHSAYGRYAKAVGGGNPYDLLPKNKSKEVFGLNLLSSRVVVERGRAKKEAVKSQGSDVQLNRELARVSLMGSAAHAAASEDHQHATNGHHADGHHVDGHHEPKQMYEQRLHPLYRWGMVVDLSACTGCSACVVACYAENNIPVVGKKIFDQGREMSWLRIERYFGDGGEIPTAEELQVHFLPMMCQHCGNAPCEPVCPVYATYHNEEGVNAMIYNRCVGTRYCSNNCPYKVRRFNWYQYEFPEPLDWQLNPDITKRCDGVMEKCTFCVQRINEAKDKAKDLGRTVKDGEVQPACVQSCPTKALAFGNLNDPQSEVSKLGRSERAYKVLDHHINTQPAVTYLERVKYKV